MANLPNMSGQPTADFTSDTRMIGLADNTMTAGTSIAPGVVFKSTVTEGVPFGLTRTVLSSPTVALFSLAVGSTASAPIIQILGQGFVSCTTIAFTTGATSGTGAIRVAYPDGVTLGWIPVLPSGTITAAARG